ncbi:MAG: TetR/AcrR family transcriptional regulator [Vicinamibacterales bacterium]
MTLKRPDSRASVFTAAATAFAEHGFDGVSVDDIARLAHLNKAMIYYHFADKLSLYRAVVGDMLITVGAAVSDIAASDSPPGEKLDRFIDRFVRLADTRPWFPTLMLREISAGAPHLDLETFAKIRTVFGAFARILTEGEAAGVFRPVQPMLAYTTVIGPLLFNVARERMAAVPGRSGLPMFVDIPHADLIAHVQLAARRMLEPR